MSCDFGPIPMPTSPLQTYWEEQYFPRSSTANQSRSAPVTTPEKNNIAPQLLEALEKLADEQQQNEEEDKVEAEQVPQRSARQVSAPHRRVSSFGQRLWSTLAGQSGAGQSGTAQKMKQS